MSGRMCQRSVIKRLEAEDVLASQEERQRWLEAITRLLEGTVEAPSRGLRDLPTRAAVRAVAPLLLEISTVLGARSRTVPRRALVELHALLTDTTSSPLYGLDVLHARRETARVADAVASHAWRPVAS